jgi:hypothetical protein
MSFPRAIQETYADRSQSCVTGVQRRLSPIAISAAYAVLASLAPPHGDCNFSAGLGSLG